MLRTKLEPPHNGGVQRKTVTHPRYISFVEIKQKENRDPGCRTRTPRLLQAPQAVVTVAFRTKSIARTRRNRKWASLRERVAKLKATSNVRTGRSERATNTRSNIRCCNCVVGQKTTRLSIFFRIKQTHAKRKTEHPITSSYRARTVRCKTARGPRSGRPPSDTATRVLRKSCCARANRWSP